jgi:hypothetical protein
MNPYERLMQEAIPVRPTRPSTTPWTPEEQAQHRTDLLDALSGWQWHADPSLSAKRRHLRLIRQADAA